jgi:magnesium-transporting ATPase (P-type)
LYAGDIIPADWKLLADNITVDESSMTGESIAVAKKVMQWSKRQLICIVLKILDLLAVLKWQRNWCSSQRFNILKYCTLANKTSAK